MSKMERDGRDFFCLEREIKIDGCVFYERRVGQVRIQPDNTKKIHIEIVTSIGQDKVTYFIVYDEKGLEVISEEPIFSTKIALSKFKEMWLSNWPTETTNNVSLTPHLQLLSSIRFNPVSKTFDAVDGLVLDDETSDQGPSADFVRMNRTDEAQEKANEMPWLKGLFINIL